MINQNYILLGFTILFFIYIVYFFKNIYKIRKIYYKNFMNQRSKRKQDKKH
jgi:hypothetical protein